MCFLCDPFVALSSHFHAMLSNMRIISTTNNDCLTDNILHTAKCLCTSFAQKKYLCAVAKIVRKGSTSSMNIQVSGLHRGAIIGTNCANHSHNPHNIYWVCYNDVTERQIQIRMDGYDGFRFPMDEYRKKHKYLQKHSKMIHHCNQLDPLCSSWLSTLRKGQPPSSP